MALGRIQLKKSESILISAVAVSLIFVFLIYWLKPRQAKLNALRAEVATALKQVNDNEIALVTLKNKAPASVELKTSNELLDQYLKSNDRFSNVISSIVEGTSESDFTVNKIITDSSTELSGYYQTLYTIEAESSFISIGKFLENLEDSPLLTEVKSIEINRSGNELRVCKASIKLFSYVAGAMPSAPRTPASEKAGAGKPGAARARAKKPENPPNPKPDTKAEVKP